MSMFYRHLFLTALFTAATAAVFAAPGMEGRIPADPTLVIPGKGAEKVLLGEDAGSVIRRRGTPDRIARFDSREELFERVYAMPLELKIPYDMIYYYRERACAVFLHRGKVTAVAGIPDSRVTDLPADLDRGMENFILNYGNEGMLVKQRDRNRAYIFPRRGITLFDDGGDDDLDLYLIFTPGAAAP